MAENNFSRFERSQIMNTAKVLKSFVTKKNALQRKIDELKKEIAGIDATQQKWEGPIMDLLRGHRIEEVIEYKQELTSNGKYSTKCVFRYPDTILPPESTSEPECPSHEAAHTDLDVDIDTDMPGHFEEVPEADTTEESVPEQDSAGFSTEDGLQEGEPAELADPVAPGPADEDFLFDT